MSDDCSGGGSEVARLMQQIEAECESLKLLTSGYAITSTHAIIAAKHSRLNVIYGQLTDVVGKSEATRMVADIYFR